MRQIALPSARDARTWQILSLGLLLAYGIAALGFDQTPGNIVLILIVALAMQWLCGCVICGKAFDPLSPIITGLSLCLLLRASLPVFPALAAALAIGSKFTLRLDGKHIFNPANFAIVVLLIGTDAVWISPGQWGSRTWLAFLFICLACLVLSRARRTETALAFLGTYIVILLARAIYLGDPIEIPMKQMQSGALLLFTFFMITDPKTIPDRRTARMLFAMLVATGGAWLQYAYYVPQGLMYALFFASPLVPLFDRLFPRNLPDIRFEWSRPAVN